MPLPKSNRAAALLALSLLAACKRDPPPPDGAQVFASVCARCHGAEGAGGLPVFDGGPSPRNFHDPEFQARVTDAQIRATIVGGKGGYMPAFGSTFDDRQLDGLVAQVRACSKKQR